MRQSGDAEEVPAARQAQPIRQKRGKRRRARQDASGTPLGRGFRHMACDAAGAVRSVMPRRLLLRHAADRGQPARPRDFRQAARGVWRRAFPSRRILAGANMFNEMPTKGRGRHA
ncbi:hypothetical protein DLM46_03935 [Paraburkholderia lacunae]|uniref:Uncharacterized protein n=1 Tax=Paraburkholderia lacunae TaxID=2211104 RepID=A0A370NEU2_9BURK|nr:hypothetical protein DLM46_03935 [Paraburkholderia lacunae]